MPMQMHAGPVSQAAEKWTKEEGKTASKRGRAAGSKEKRGTIKTCEWKAGIA
jgi:hypothetical protein